MVLIFFKGLLLVRCDLSYHHGLLVRYLFLYVMYYFKNVSCRVNFKLKSDTDLFTIVKCKTAVSSIEVAFSILWWFIFSVVLSLVFLSIQMSYSCFYPLFTIATGCSNSL